MTLAGSFNSLAFGPGTDIHVASLEGVEDLPAIRSNDDLRSGDHGAFRGTDLLGEREIVMTFHLRDFNGSYETLRDTFKNAMVISTNTEIPLKLYGSTRRINCRVRRRNVPVICDRIQNYATATVQFIASDPRVYDEALSTSGTIGLPASTGGLVIPADVPWVLGASSSGGTFTATNSGNFPTRPIAVITGPATNPRIENVTAGKTVQFDLALGATDSLTIDFDSHSVLLNGTASRRSTMTSSSQWWELAPGDSTIRFNANAYDAAASLVLTYRSAWI